MIEGPTNTDWREIGEFEKGKNILFGSRTIGLYHIAGQPVLEFVLRLTDQEGNHHVDNNGGYGINYHVRPWQGFQFNVARAMTLDDMKFILLFPRMVSVSGIDSVLGASFDDR